LQVNVMVRKRPLNKKELAGKAFDVVTMFGPDTGLLVLHEPKVRHRASDGERVALTASGPSWLGAPRHGTAVFWDTIRLSQASSHKSLTSRHPSHPAWQSKVDLSKCVENHNFLFDTVFDESTGSDEVYDAAVKPLVEEVLSARGCMATAFAYGQTGALPPAPTPTRRS
jgi:hypothetical protein